MVEQKKLWKVSFWDGSRLINMAENIVAPNKDEAVIRAIRAISHRRRAIHPALRALYHNLTIPYPTDPAPDWLAVYVAGVGLGERVR